MAPTSVVDRSAAATRQLEDRITDAMLDCISRWGIGKTTADDIARSAGISRATLYRVFPGGKEVALDALLRRETGRFFDAVTGPLAEATSLEDALVLGLVEAARFVRDHEPLQYLLVHEPERVRPLSEVDGLRSAFSIAAAFTAPHLRPYLADDQAAADGADWLVRQFFSYVMVPAPTLDLTEEPDVRRFVRRFVLPGLTNQE